MVKSGLAGAQTIIEPKENDHRFVFLGGLHRSGTTALCRMLGADERFSIFRDTGAIEDEGQFLQTVYQPDGDYGGPGVFALNAEAKLDETSEIVSSARGRLFQEWSSYWDTKKSLLVEKTPANLIRSRFLQEVFPNSAFVFVMRHPVAACMATVKWTGAYATTLIENWLAAHECLLSDFSHLRSAVLLSYEAFVNDPESARWALETELEVDALNCDFGTMKPGMNMKYYRKWITSDFHFRGPWWKDRLKRIRNRFEVFDIEHKYESRLNVFGYSFRDVHLALSDGIECRPRYNSVFRSSHSTQVQN